MCLLFVVLLSLSSSLMAFFDLADKKPHMYSVMLENMRAICNSWDLVISAFQN